MGDGGLPVLRSAEATERAVPVRFPSRRSPLEEGRHSRGMAGKAHLPGEGDGVKYADCPEMIGIARRIAGEKVCRKCARALVGRQEAWCSNACAAWWRVNHWFSNGSRFLRRENPPCCICGERGAEVDHIDRANGAHHEASCIHHLSNLRVLCKRCHREVTNAQIRADAERRREKVTA